MKNLKVEYVPFGEDRWQDGELVGFKDNPTDRHLFILLPNDKPMYVLTGGGEKIELPRWRIREAN